MLSGHNLVLRFVEIKIASDAYRIRFDQFFAPFIAPFYALPMYISGYL